MSKKIPVDQWLDIFEKMYQEHWSYVYGSAKEGAVDCSGAFVYAAQKLGDIKIGQHSSNYIARNNVEMVPVSEAKPGYAAFRHSAKFGTNELAQKYNDGLGNFRHIGVVSKDGKHVWHAQDVKNGFVETKLDSSWYCCGKLNFVDYDIQTETAPDASAAGMYIVRVESDSWLNIREKPGVTSKRIGRLRPEEVVEVLENRDNWSRIVYGDTFGWVYTKYIEPLYPPVENGTNDEADDICVQVVIVDSAGNEFRPVGDYTTTFEFYTADSESVD